MGGGKTYSNEENNWLTKVYPVTGARKTYKMFQLKFNRKPGWEGFKSHLKDLGLKVTSERWREACKNNGTRTNVEIGTIVKRGRGGNYIKVAEGTKGWIPLSKYFFGDISPNEMIVHLDGDKSNDDINNLMVISRKTAARLTGCNMWSENPEITKTAIIWSCLVDLSNSQVNR